MRRYDVDWLRISALGLLIVYHNAIGFQPWAFTLLFIQNKEPMEGLWPLMSLINVWRIPVLFLVSGMGVCFAMKRRNWQQLLKDRAVRILMPLVFGFFFICPLSVLLALNYYGEGLAYVPNAGHLWFLGNIFLYVVLLLPLLTYLQARPECLFFRLAGRLVRRPLTLPLVAVPLMVETWILDPQPFALYAQTLHGFWLGMLCFFMGFTFVSLGAVFWQAVEETRHGALTVALLLAMGRTLVYGQAGEIGMLMALESMAWMLTILGHGSRYLNRPSAGLMYLGQAVYPVYILHMPVQFGLSCLVMPLNLWPAVKLVTLLAGTLAICLGLYELIIKRRRWIRPLFGMKMPGGEYLPAPTSPLRRPDVLL
jgi:glucan biosynthesis protein C